ncbi:hypothetical protein QEN19_000134 [Hanseniaspora menglaensis]
MSDSESEFQSQMDLQRLAFERQFGSLEEMGFDDETRKNESEDSISSGNESENESAELELNITRDSDEDTFSENEAFFDSDIEMDLNEHSEKNDVSREVKSKKQPRVISFGSTINDEIDKFSSTKLTDKIIKKMQNKQKPKTGKITKKNSKQAEDSEDEEESERKNLQNDVDLQNFIRDSHLLNSFGGSDFNSSSDVMGKARMKVMESQMKNLVSQNHHISKKNKNNIVDKLEKVPLHIRKGMIDKHVKRINKYEEDAKDNGIVLAKQAKGAFRKINFTYKQDIERRIGKGIKSKIDKTPVMRDKGLRINAVGRSTRNGLVISKNDISRINGEINKKRGKGGKTGGKFKKK